MRIPLRLVVAVLGAASCTAAAAQDAIARNGPEGFPLSSSVSVPGDARIVYVSGTVPAVADESAEQGTVARYGDTEAQTNSILDRIETELAKSDMSLGDIVMMRVFLVAPPGAEQMDFAGMMRRYTARFGSEAQPNKPARSAMQVAGLVDPGWLVEIEVTAAK